MNGKKVRCFSKHPSTCLKGWVQKILRTIYLFTNVQHIKILMICIAKEWYVKFESFYECFYMDNFDLGMSLLRDVGDTYHLEEIDLLGMIRVSRWPPGCDERKQLLDEHIGWCGPYIGEYTVYAYGALEFLWNVDVVHKLTTYIITFQSEDECNPIEESFLNGKYEDEDPHRYCKSN
uniref:Uncharacterized protein n=1 Tax=Lactuca sativa TaxID=4236 RepID=A0A9R1VZ70_LACSA|nr:hypothetical protein LSAT_V11C400181490 [Lactuca sativa]